MLERIEQLILEISTVVTKDIDPGDLVRRHGKEKADINQDAETTLQLGAELLNRLATPVIMAEGYVHFMFFLLKFVY